jgi:hypothetical protein
MRGGAGLDNFILKPGSGQDVIEDFEAIDVVVVPLNVNGTGVFIETVRLVGSFAFDTVGVRRLETRLRVHAGNGDHNDKRTHEKRLQVHGTTPEIKNRRQPRCAMSNANTRTDRTRPGPPAA